MAKELKSNNNKKEYLTKKQLMHRYQTRFFNQQKQVKKTLSNDECEKALEHEICYFQLKWKRGD